MCHPYARSATLRNFRENANSRKPRQTLMQFIQPPLLGALFSHAGNMANSVNGRAKATAKPNMPTVGAKMEPVVLTSTSRNPMMGPVHEKLTRLKVKAMRNILHRPVAASDFLSTAFVHLAGSVISKPPRKLAANTSSIKKKNTLKTALVLRAFNALAPNTMVTSSPSKTYMTTILIPYVTASRMPSDLSLPRLRKKLTVMGMMGHTQGVSNARSPPRKPSRKMAARLSSCVSPDSPMPRNSSTTGDHSSLPTPWADNSCIDAKVSDTDSTTLSTSSGEDMPSWVTMPSCNLPCCLPSPVMEKSTSVGGMQFSSLHAP